MTTNPPDRREQILDAAARLLADGGIGKTSVARIARAAGVAVGSVYLEFAGKDAIVEALSARRLDRLLDAMQSAGADGPWAERLGRVMAVRTRALRRMADDGAHGAEMLRCCCPGAAAAWRRFRVGERALLDGLLAAGRAAGALRADARITGGTVLRAYAAFTPPALLDLDDETLDGALEAMHRLIFNGLGREPGPADPAQLPR